MDQRIAFFLDGGRGPPHPLPFLIALAVLKSIYAVKKIRKCKGNQVKISLLSYMTTTVFAHFVIYEESLLFFATLLQMYRAIYVLVQMTCFCT